MNQDKLKELRKIHNFLLERDTLIELEDLCFYEGIININLDISEEEMVRLLNVCQQCSSSYINPLILSSDLSAAVYDSDLISLDDLERVPSEDIIDMFLADEIINLKNYIPESEKEI